MYRVSISTCFDYTIPFERQLTMIRNAGFPCVSMDSNYAHNGLLDMSRLSGLMSLLGDIGLSVDTVHGYHLDQPDTLETNRRIAGAAASLGAPVVVLHCCSFTFGPSEIDARRSDILNKLPVLENIARESGVRFAFENVLPGVATDLTEEILSVADPGYFGFCYDSSHDQIDGPRPFDLLERQTDRLMAVHISDRIREYEDHAIPGEGFVDFDPLCALLARARMRFPLLLEVMTAYSAHKEPSDFLSVSYARAKMLCEKILEMSAGRPGVPT